ncbi:MAG: isoprenyl transferase [Planctomycetota bacterium]
MSVIDSETEVVNGLTPEQAADAVRERVPSADPLTAIAGVHPAKLPRHVAIIMDGNGRWAEARGFPRIFGHRNGASAVRRVLTEAGRIGIECLTLYSFSSENWKRPADEITALMQLCVEYCSGEAEHLQREDIRVRVIGRRDRLPDDVVSAIETLEETTADCRGVTLCLAIDYGSRDEMVRAITSLAEDVKAGDLDPADVDEAQIESRLDTAGLPHPDLLIRTAGEMRLSNYLLWQLSYAELYVTDTLWPDFDEGAFHTALRAFASRNRRFGGLNHDLGQDLGGGCAPQEPRG